MTNPAYSLDETLIVAELGYRHSWASYTTISEEIEGISKALRNSNLGEKYASDPKFRNINGIQRKYEDLKTRTPGYTGKLTRGSRNDYLAIAMFEQFPDLARRWAESAWTRLDLEPPSR